VTLFGAIEAGGSKWRCAVGTGPGDLRAEVTIPTTSPAETIGAAAAFLEREGPVDALGIGCFGPVDLDPSSPTWGYVTTTPKRGWAHTDVARQLGGRLAVPVAFETDVNAAAVGEGRWGAAVGLDTFCYITIGTGIGGGAVVGGHVVHGLLHPEFGHLRVPHDLARDPFAGACPYHGDCWEGLAAAPAIEARWGKPPHELDGHDEVWELEARYLALGLVAAIAILSPQRIVFGGGVMQQPGLLDRVRAEVVALVAGYLETPLLGERIAEYVVAPALGQRAGVLGALALAREALP
jgi:fructokinase